MAAPPSEFVTLVSNDGFEFIVRRESAYVAGTIKRMLDPTSNFAESISGRCKFENINGVVLEKVCEYLYYNEKHKNAKDVPDMEIPPELCLELLMAADYLNDKHNPEKEELGGLVLTNGITNQTFFSMLDILLIVDTTVAPQHGADGTFSVQDQYGMTIERNGDPFQPGDYYIGGFCSINNERCLTRTLSVSTGTHLEAFRDAVRTRDARCVITGKVALEAPYYWGGFEAAHIFPLAYEGHWREKHYGRWITIQPPTGGSINSVQNGLLLRADIHGGFDNYAISVNPDENYKIVCFRPDGDNVAGKCLDRQFLDCPDRPVDQLLRWHFRQAVLTNMRGAGEPLFENDFSSGTDMMGEILAGPKPTERLEFELFNRLALHS